MNLDTLQNKIVTNIDLYRSGAYLNLDSLREVYRELRFCHYQLTALNIEAFRSYNSILYNFNGSVARGEIEANEKVPELRMTRRLLIAVKIELDALRSELSILKNE